MLIVFSKNGRGQVSKYTVVPLYMIPLLIVLQPLNMFYLNVEVW